MLLEEAITLATSLLALRHSSLVSYTARGQLDILGGLGDNIVSHSTHAAQSNHRGFMAIPSCGDSYTALVVGLSIINRR